MPFQDNFREWAGQDCVQGANGFVSLLRLANLQGGESRAFNLGTGRGYSVRDVVRAVERATGIEGISRNAERRAGDPPELVADASSSGSVLRWQPQCSDLDTIVRSALGWHVSRLPATGSFSEDREVVSVGLAE